MSVRWLVVGIGDITTKRVLPAILDEPRSTLCGIVTRTPAKAERYGVPAWTSLDQALHEAAPDAVYIATPVSMHAPQTIAALHAGKHVLCEKPVALNYAQAVTMRDAQIATGQLLGIAYYRRTYPKLLRARQLLTEGAIGRPVFAEINCHSWTPPEDRGWLIDPAMSGGGPLYDIGSHRIDVLNFLFGKPARVCGQVSNVVHELAVEDSATVMIDYESGVRGVVDVRWNSRVDRDDFRIIGTEGDMVLTPLNSPRLQHPGGEESWPTHRNLHFPCVANFVDAVEGVAPVAAPIEEAIVTDWVTEQVVRA